MEDLVDLRVVDDAADVAALLVHDLDERAEDRPRCEHRRGDPNPLLRLPDVLRDPVRERLAVLGAKPGAHLHAVHLQRTWVAAGMRDLPALPELLEREREGVGDLGRAHGHDDVLLPCPGVVRPVRRPGPDGLAVAHDVLVVHEVGNARDAAGVDRQPLDRVGRRLRWWRNRDRPGVGDVVEEAYRDSALGGREERGEHEPSRVGFESDVVHREIEVFLASREKAGEQPRDVRSPLPSIGQRREFDRRLA